MTIEMQLKDKKLKRIESNWKEFSGKKWKKKFWSKKKFESWKRKKKICKVCQKIFFWKRFKEKKLFSKSLKKKEQV